jgi:hypothetical protein
MTNQSDKVSRICGKDLCFEGKRKQAVCFPVVSNPIWNQLCTVNNRLSKDAAVLQLFDSESSCVSFKKLDRRWTLVLLLMETLRLGLTGDLHEKAAGAPA